jgi:hypothetical protein
MRSVLPSARENVGRWPGSTACATRNATIEAAIIEAAIIEAPTTIVKATAFPMRTGSRFGAAVRLTPRTPPDQKL